MDQQLARLNGFRNRSGARVIGSCRADAEQIRVICGQSSCSAMLEPTQVLSLLKSTPIILPWLMRTRLFTRAGSPFSGQINIIRISAFDFGPSVVGTNAAYSTFFCKIHSYGFLSAESFSRLGSMSTPSPANE